MLDSIGGLAGGQAEPEEEDDGHPLTPKSKHRSQPQAVQVRAQPFSPLESPRPID